VTAADVTDRLRLSPSSVRRLAAELRPTRCVCGTKIYPAIRAALS